jgi:hypothetical protein
MITKQPLTKSDIITDLWAEIDYCRMVDKVSECEHCGLTQEQVERTEQIFKEDDAIIEQQQQEIKHWKGKYQTVEKNVGQLRQMINERSDGRLWTNNDIWVCLGIDDLKIARDELLKQVFNRLKDK